MVARNRPGQATIVLATKASAFLLLSFLSIPSNASAEDVVESQQDERSINSLLNEVSGYGQYHADFNGSSPSLDSQQTQSSSRSTGEVKSYSRVGFPYVANSVSIGRDQQISPFMRDTLPATFNTANSDVVTGAFHYDYPIIVPPGRNGAQPDVELNYSNQAHRQDDIFGFGWTLSTPYIERENYQGIGTLYSTTTARFYSSLSGELATTSTAGLYVARNDDGSDLKYTFNDNVWVVTDKLGTTYTFGTTTNSRQDSPSDSSKVYKWMLEGTKDANGNEVSYSYFKDSGQIYPSSISYTGTATSSGIFSVDFNHSLRASAAATTSDTGFPVQTLYKIDQISTSVNGTWARKYDLTYGSGDNGAQLLLTSISPSGLDESSTTTSLPVETFSYSTTTSNSYSHPSWGPPVQVVDDLTDKGVAFADINGDGLTDITFSREDGVTHSKSWGEYLASATTTGWVTVTWPTPCSFTQYSGSDQWDPGTRTLLKLCRRILLI